VKLDLQKITRPKSVPSISSNALSNLVMSPYLLSQNALHIEYTYTADKTLCRNETNF